MLMSHDFKPEKVVASEKMRQALLHVLLDGEYVVATDGHCMVIGKLEDTKVNCLVSVESLQYARKLSRKLDPNFDVTDTHDVHTNGVMYPRPGIETSKYPNWKKVISKESPKNTITFNRKTLDRVFDALGGDTFHVEVVDTRSHYMLRVFAHGKMDRFGIVMPAGSSFDRNHYFNETNITE